jgi:hypothetical protein
LTLQDLGSLGEFIAAIATLVTLVYLAAQIRQNTNSVRSATSASISDALSRGTETLSSDPELTRIWFLGSENYESLTDEEERRFQVYLLTYLRRLENAFYQKERGLVDPDHWQTTERFLANIMSQPGVLHNWKRSKSRYSDRFQQFVEDHISDSPAA